MLKNYLKTAWKVLGRNKFFTGISLFGISFTLAILVVVTTFYDHLVHPKYPEVNRERCAFVQRVEAWNEERSEGQIARGSFYFMEHYVQQMNTPKMIAIASFAYPTLTFVNGEPLPLQLMHTCENFWKVHEFEFLEGGPYTKKDITDNRFAAVISKATRDAYFGSEPTVAGKSIEVDKIRYQVVGVVQNVPVYQNITFSDIYTSYNTAQYELEQYGFTGDFMAIMLADRKSDIPAIQAEYETMVANIDVRDSEMLTVLQSKANSYQEFLAWELFGSEESKVGQYYFLLVGGIFLFMLLPALNLTNLNSSRIMDRASEIGVRKAFGATSSVLTVQFIVENIVLSLLGGALGLFLGWLILRVIEATDWIRHAKLEINFGVFLTGLGLTLFFGLLSGALPAWRMSRLQIVNAIKGEL